VKQSQRNRATGTPKQKRDRDRSMRAYGRNPRALGQNRRAVSPADALRGAGPTSDLPGNG